MKHKQRESPKARKQGAGAAGGRASQRHGSRGAWILLAGGGVFVLGVLLASFLAIAVNRGEDVRGESAPDITVATTNGEFTLSQHRGKVVALYFSFPG